MYLCFLIALIETTRHSPFASTATSSSTTAPTSASVPIPVPASSSARGGLPEALVTQVMSCVDSMEHYLQVQHQSDRYITPQNRT